MVKVGWIERVAEKKTERKRGRGREKGVLVPSRGSNKAYEHVHAAHPLGTRPLFMLDIIPLSQNMHTSPGLLTCALPGATSQRGATRRFSAKGCSALLCAHRNNGYTLPRW